MYASGRLLRETFGDTTIDFFYSNSGQLYALKHNGTTYYYITNLQGDVMSNVDGTGAVVVSYEYDPYGNVLSTTGTLADTLGEINPLRNRGYVYDQETDLYYLQSRYYDPSIGRFLNPDSYPSTGQGIIGNNMFAYCGNNPVKRVDAEGYLWDLVWDVVSLGFSIAEVIQNPDDPMAWVGLAGDVIDVAVPFVGGAGETVRAVNAGRKISDATGNVLDVAKAADRVDDTLDGAKVGWSLGDDITNATKAGNTPSWSTVRQRYWKNEAYYNPDNYTASNLARMQSGRAPLVELDGKYYSMELHHIEPRRSGGSNAYSNLMQVTPWEHAAIDPYRHFNP